MMVSRTPRHSLLIALMAGLLLTIAYIPPLQMLRTFLLGGDFSYFWGAARLASTQLALFYDPVPYMDALRSVLPPGALNVNNLPFAYPLHSLFFYSLFAWLPYYSGFLAWLVTGVAAFFLIAHQAFTPAHRPLALLVLFASPAMVVAILSAQNGLFISAGALGVLLLIRHEKFAAAGILLGCLTIKPHLFILWPIALIMQRQWRVIFFAAVTTILLLAASVAVYGVAAWQQWLAVVPGAQWDYATYFNPAETPRMFQMMMPGLPAAVRLVGAPLVWVAPLYATVTLLLAAAIAYAFRRPLTLAQQVLLLASASLLATPYAFNYDMLLFTTGLILLWLERPPQRRSALALGLLAYGAPLLVYVVNFHRLPMIPLVLLGVFVQCWCTSRDNKNHEAGYIR